MSAIEWRKKAEAGDYPAAQSYLALVYPESRAKALADGYHRLCAAYSFNEDAEIPCQIT